jgi:hypothetical protein
MAVSSESRLIVDQLLSDCISQFEEGSLQGHFNILEIRFVGGVARLLGYEPYAERCQQLLSIAPDRAFFAGMIANFKLPDKATPTMRSIYRMEQLEASYPVFSESYIRDYVTTFCNSDSHLALAISGQYQEAFAACKAEVEVEEVALTQAVLGDIEAALASARSIVKPESRAQGVVFVCTIELFRRDRLGDARAHLESFYPPGLHGSSAGQMALGVCNRVPWGGYPYPDW